MPASLKAGIETGVRMMVDWSVVPSKKLKILIVEDESISRLLLKEMLGPFGVCHDAADGEKALSLLKQAYTDGNLFDLVCLDIMLPGFSGHEILQEIRKYEKKYGLQGEKTAKVIMISALCDTENIMRAVINGRCQAYLTKPVCRKNLEDNLRYLHLIPLQGNECDRRKVGKVG